MGCTRLPSFLLLDSVVLNVHKIIRCAPRVATESDSREGVNIYLEETMYPLFFPNRTCKEIISMLRGESADGL